MSGRDMLIRGANDVRTCLSMTEAVVAMRQAFAWFPRGRTGPTAENAGSSLQAALLLTFVTGFRSAAS